jgi:elongation factor P
MAVLSYNEITIKKVIIFNDEPCIVISSHVFRKQKRKPVNNTKLKSLVSGRLIENTFHVNETAEEADLENWNITFVYRKGNDYVFHLTGKPAERFNLSADLVGDQGKFIKDKSELSALVFNDNIIGVKIPIKIELKVTETVDASKGNTSGNALKESIVETGAKVMVPMFINQGDIIAINTESGDYSERVEKA